MRRPASLSKNPATTALLARSIRRSCIGAFAAFVCLAMIQVSPSVADPTYGVMNAEGGIYWRSGPDWNTPVQTVGFGFYPDTVIAVHCYQAGAGNVPGSADYMWEYATDVGGSGFGTGWVNEHFINDGQPINQASPGVPPCESAPPAPPPNPAPAAPSGLVFTIFNAEGGIYYRTGPHWIETRSEPGVGVYNGDQVELICGAFGDAVGPYADTAWSKVRNLTRPGIGEGWVNEHYINDGAPSNSFVSGEPACPGSSSGGTAAPGNGSLYFSPYSANPHGSNSTGQIRGDHAPGLTNWVNAPSPATITLNENDWNQKPDAEDCPSLDYLVPTGNPAFDGGRITTLASWSLARATPFLFLRKRPDLQTKINYILLFDPGADWEWDSSACVKEYPIGAILRSWLIASPANKLVVLSGEKTADPGATSVDGHGHAGIQNHLFYPLKRQGEPAGRHLRSQIVVCNYDSMSHPDVWINFRSWMNKSPITPSSCPTNPETGKRPIAWNP